MPVGGRKKCVAVAISKKITLFKQDAQKLTLDGDI